MIRHHFHRFNGNVQISGLLKKNFLQSDINSIRQDGSSVLGTENNMILILVHNTRFSVVFICHIASR